MFSLVLQQAELRRGDRISGRVLWSGSASPKAIEVRIQWRTEGRGNIEGTWLPEIILPASRGAFSSQIPLTAPYSYDGHLIRIVWEVKAIAEFAGILAQPQTHIQPFRVLPG